VEKPWEDEEPYEEPGAIPIFESPGPVGASASAIAARHLIEAAGCDSWFLKLPSGDWEEVVKFWPPPEHLDVATKPMLKKKPKPDTWNVRKIAMRCQRHEEMVRALLAAQFGSALNYSAAKFPCPQAQESCFWTQDARQLVCEAEANQDDKKDAVMTLKEVKKEKTDERNLKLFERCPPEGSRCVLLKNIVRSQLAMVFKADKLRKLERATRRGDNAAVQSLLAQLGSAVPAGLKEAAKKRLSGFKPEEAKAKGSFAKSAAPGFSKAEPAKAKAPDLLGAISAPPAAPKPPPAAPKPPPAAPKESPETSALPVKAKGPPPKFKATFPAPAEPKADSPATAPASAKDAPVEQKAAEAQEASKEGSQPPVTAEEAGFGAKRPTAGGDAMASDEAAPWKKRRRERAPAGKEPKADDPAAKPNVKELLPRKVVLSNVALTANVQDLTDFFTGAIFSATGHKWQGGSTQKTIVDVQMQGGSHAEVTFATQLGATIAVALNGMSFKDKALVIKRPTGFTGPPLNRAKLQSVSIKDLVEFDGSIPETEPVEAEPAAPKADEKKTVTVKLSGIPPSMKAKSVFDLLQQFGGPVKSLNLPINRESGEHSGSGTADFNDAQSAVEAARYSPLLGFIEVSLEDGTPSEAADGQDEKSQPKRQRRHLWDPAPEPSAPVAPPVVTEDDLGPFAAALEKVKRVPPTAPAAELDLGPFEAVLPPVAPAVPAPAADLGPFESVLPPLSAAQDLGPFESVLPPAPSQPEEKPPSAFEDLGPFNFVLPPRRTVAQGPDPFAPAARTFKEKSS